jgi:hypothetical protein
MSVHDFAEWATILQTLIAAGAAIFIICQIKSNETENKKWKTLDVCAQHEFSDQIAASVARLRQFYNPTLTQVDGAAPNLVQLANDTRVVCNYLDGIAIGVRQGLYIEGLARDHLSAIVRRNIRGAFEENRNLVPRDDFARLIAMDQTWQVNAPYYQADRHVVVRFLAHPVPWIVVAALALAALAIWHQ